MGHCLRTSNLIAEMGFYYNQPQGFYYQQQPKGFYYNQQPEGFYYQRQPQGFYYNQQQGFFTTKRTRKRHPQKKQPQRTFQRHGKRTKTLSPSLRRQRNTHKPRSLPS